MSEQVHPAISATSDAVDPRSLAEQLGSAEELTTLSPTACAHQLTRVHSLPALRSFLADYQQKILGPCEYRYIYEAYSHATANHLKELLALDKHLARDKNLKEFQLASRHVGKRQLNRMKPLRDLRLIQRYRDAVNAGEAFGWHTLVYGLVLSTYSIPLRQGLLHYGRQTLGGFIHSAAKSLDLRESTCIELQNELTLTLPPMIDETVSGPDGSPFRVLK